MDLEKDFRKFAISNTKIRATVLDDKIKQAKDFLTPYILEERQLNVTQMDIFSRLLFDRILYFTGEVNQSTCDTMNAELLYLDSVDNRDINLYINSPGGSVVDGLSVIDTMNFIKSDVSTTCMGMAASMGSVLLSNGTKGKRFVLPHSRVMIHSVASGFQGHTADVRIEMEQTERCQKDVYQILADNTGHTFEEMEKLCDRDNWFIGDEAVNNLHIADKVIVPTNK
jgi:ATP-dependent Clp protease protease subunit